MSTMLAARDQENLVSAHQQVAASKPLNQNVRGLHPKTPSNLKTPFRSARNDENRPLELKSQKTLIGDGRSKLDKAAFVTPGPQTRAPLGQKTTNAKAQPFKTPGPIQQNTKAHQNARLTSTTRRSARSKIHIAPPEPVEADVLAQEEEDDEPDYGYAPPKPIELPDPPLEITYDDPFSFFRPENMFRNYGELYCTSPTDENGVSLRLKREEEIGKAWEEEQDKLLDKHVEFPAAGPTDDELEAQVDAMIVAGPKSMQQISKVDTVRARSAANLLSKPESKLPSAAMRPTKSSEQKKKAIDSTTSRRPAPASVSRNTIGFPKAKPAPSIIPKSEQMKPKKHTTNTSAVKMDQNDIHPRDFVRLYGQPPVESRMWFRLKEYEWITRKPDDGEDESDPTEDLFHIDDLNFGINDENEEVFQLPMPE